MKKCLALILSLLLTSCSLFSITDTQLSKTSTALAGSATALAERATQLAETASASAGGTATAAAMETAIAGTLTALAPTITQTSTQTNTPLPSDTPTLTPLPSDTPTSTPTQTLTPTKAAAASSSSSSGPCYVVLDDWCNSHQGCATMNIHNKTQQSVTLYFRHEDYGVNVTFTVAAGNPTSRCTMVLRPGRYYYRFTYCGGVSDGYHALNDNWYIQFQC